MIACINDASTLRVAAQALLSLLEGILRFQPARWRGARATGRCSFHRTPDICKASPCEGGCRTLTRLAAGNQCALHEGNPLRFPGVELRSLKCDAYRCIVRQSASDDSRAREDGHT